MHEKNDKLAFAGYDFALSNGKNNKSNLIETDMDLMAFNAGITNANVRHDLNVETIKCSTTRRYHDNYKGASDKELSVIC